MWNHACICIAAFKTSLPTSTDLASVSVLPFQVPPEQTDIMDIMDQNDLMELDAAWWLDAMNMWRFWSFPWLWLFMSNALGRLRNLQIQGEWYWDEHKLASLSSSVWTLSEYPTKCSASLFYALLQRTSLKKQHIFKLKGCEVDSSYLC